MSIGRMVRGAAVALALLALTACASLPVTGDVRPGLAANQSDGGSDLAFVPQGPSDGMDPKEIVRGFIDAASSPKDSWGIARQFLTSDEAQKWKPDAGVTIDTGSAERRFDVPDVPKEATTAVVHLSLQQTATVDETGAYSGQPVNRAAELPFALAKNKNGQWRISQAPDGIVLDADSFAAADVFAPYALQYFDPTWTYLVPDVRWFPKRENTASRIVQSLVGGKPSPWLVNGVRTAFTGDIALARNTVTPESQVAEIVLTDAALSVDPVALSRMRTQLERSLIGVGVQQVRITIAGRDTNAGSAAAASTTVDSRPLVLTEKGFGFLAGGELAPIGGVSAQVEAFPHPSAARRGAGRRWRGVRDRRRQDRPDRRPRRPDRADPGSVRLHLDGSGAGAGVDLRVVHVGDSAADRRSAGRHAGHLVRGEQGRRAPRDGRCRGRAVPDRGLRDHARRPRRPYRPGPRQRDRLAHRRRRHRLAR
jgi:hypothetical protein